MSVDGPYDVLIAGGGAAGLSAALGALEFAAESATRDVRIGMLERAPKEHRGGNTYWSTAGFRMSDENTLTPDFYEYWEPRSRNIEPYVKVLGQDAPNALKWLIGKGLTFDVGDPVFMTTDKPRMRPNGDGQAIVDLLYRDIEATAEGVPCGPAGEYRASIEVLYEQAAVGLVFDEDGAVTGLRVRSRDGRVRAVSAGAVILATGGFEGNSEMLTRYLGYEVPPISRGGTYNRGEGTTMALAAGAKPTGQWNEFHPLPADPRTMSPDQGRLTFAALMETIPYSIVVNKAGQRFMDEGQDSMDELYDVVARSVQRQQDQTAYIIYDDATAQDKAWQKAVSRDMTTPSYQADTIAELAALLDLDPSTLEETVRSFNEATSGDQSGFDPFRTDGLATERELEPRKSNWAKPIVAAPFYAIPATCAVVFCFGGIGTNEDAEVITADDTTIAGLYAAGAMTGVYHHDYVGATSVMRSIVFGRIAGRRALEHSGSAA